MRKLILFALLCSHLACGSIPKHCRGSAAGMGVGAVAVGMWAGALVGMGVGLAKTPTPPPGDLYIEYQSYRRPFAMGAGIGAAVGAAAIPLGVRLGHRVCMGGPQASEMLPMPITATTREQVIASQFAERELSPIEGIWLEQGSAYEIAIFRNRTTEFPEYDYLAIVIHTIRENWRFGEVKALIRKTSSPSSSAGLYYDASKKPLGSEFTVIESNRLQIEYNTDLDSKAFDYLRTYPDSP